VKYLLDVNALLALLLLEHVFHSQTQSWVTNLDKAPHSGLLTCPVTELGFIRIASQPSAFGFSVPAAQRLLAQAKLGATGLQFVEDKLSAPHLPAWLVKSAHVTNGYLLDLAKSHGATLATLDAGIPGAFLIPA
jgi:uncharacterized protein